MGSPIIADLTLQNLELHTLKNLSFIPLFYMWMILLWLLLNELLEKFNSFHPRLNFTIKIGDISLNFLELIFINRDGKP